MNGAAFKVFIEKCLLPQLGAGAVVVMDNLPAHKISKIAPLIQSVGAKVLYLQQIPCIFGTRDSVHKPKKMKAYSIEFRTKIVKAYEQGDTSVRKVVQRFDVSKAFVQKILKQKQTTGHVQPKKPGGSLKSVLHSSTTKLIQMVEKYPDSTLSEYCEYWLESYQQSVS
ncbi:hypothetical protein QUA20_08600 [Microcoleus sp. Pol7_A1]